MQSIQTSHTFSLSSVKPLERLLEYRGFCLKATQKAFSNGTKRRSTSLINNSPLEPFGHVGELDYLVCKNTGSFFLADLPSAETWAQLLAEVSEFRNSSQAFHKDIAKSRLENVFEPKLNWIQNTLRLGGILQPKIMEVTTPPSPFYPLLEACQVFSEVLTVNEMDLIRDNYRSDSKVDAAVLLESLDRVNDPVVLLQRVSQYLKKDGHIFVTAQVASGFDIKVLGVKNAYIYPPDRTNCFSLSDLKRLVTEAGFDLLEVSTPGVLDIEVVKTHLQHDPTIPLSYWERQLLESNSDTHQAFQAFLQQCNISSFARIVATKEAN